MIGAIKLWDHEQYEQITPSHKFNSLINNDYLLNHSQYSRNDRNQEVTISLTVDGYASEASWNVWDYSEGSYYYSTNQTFQSNNETIQQTFTFANGSYSVDIWDSYGDGGVTGSVTNAGGDVLVSWLGSDYTNFGEFLFDVGDPEAFGCTDPDALNFDEDADTDDGSCQYSGDACVNALQAINGTNYADGDNEYFVYTATVNGGLIISSVSETNDEDTRLMWLRAVKMLKIKIGLQKMMITIILKAFTVLMLKYQLLRDKIILFTGQTSTVQDNSLGH